MDYGLHLINTQVPLILRIYENGSTVNQGFVASHEHGVSVKNHPMGGTMVKLDNHVLKKVPIVIISFFRYYRMNDYSYSKNILKRDSYEFSIA